MLNLTMLAPDIVEAFLRGCLLSERTLFELAVDPPSLWHEQRQKLFTAFVEQICRDTAELYSNEFL